MPDYSGLFPKTKGKDASKGLSSIFTDNEFLRDWRPTQTEDRSYTQGGVWNRAYIDQHGDVPSQLRDALRNFRESGFWRRRNADTGLWEYQSSIPATYETLRRTGAHLYPNAPQFADEAAFNAWKNTWEQVGGPVAQQLRGNTPWNTIAHDPAIQPFLDRYAPDPARSPTAPPLNIPKVVEGLANQQADRVRRAGGIYRDNLRASATDLRTALEGDQWGQAGEVAARSYAGGLFELLRELGRPIDIEGDPSYRLRQSEARRAVDAAFAGAGLGQSGARGRALQRTASELASHEYAAADARRRANVQAQAGIQQSGFDRLIAQLNRRSDEFQEREREFTKADQYGLGAEYQSALQAISQLGLGQGAALDRIIEERDAESDRRDLEYLRAIQNEQRRKAEAEARAAAKRAKRGKLYSDILGTVGAAAGGFLGGPAFATILQQAGQKAGQKAGS